MGNNGDNAAFFVIIVFARSGLHGNTVIDHGFRLNALYIDGNRCRDIDTAFGSRCTLFVIGVFFELGGA